MNASAKYSVYNGWRVILTDVGLNPADVLKRARLPADLFQQSPSALSPEEYFRFWVAMEEEAADPLLPLKIGASIPVEAFDPLLFAALCSSDLVAAVKRIGLFKKMLGPMALHMTEHEGSAVLQVEWLHEVEPPSVLVATELVFMVRVARLATRAPIRPLQVTTPNPPKAINPYKDFFGVPIQQGPCHTVTFRAEDAKRPFLTANEQMWNFFEPELRARLSEMRVDADIGQRVRGALVELLPAGQATIEAASKQLGVSPRTLQRKLGASGKSFRGLLDATRTDLARHYLKASSLSCAEISYLLGYDDPNSFSRAFHSWTGMNPEHVREG
jgi:AraC-like DNA-binding protein